MESTKQEKKARKVKPSNYTLQIDKSANGYGWALMEQSKNVIITMTKYYKTEASAKAGAKRYAKEIGITVG